VAHRMGMKRKAWFGRKDADVVGEELKNPEGGLKGDMGEEKQRGGKSDT